MENNLLHKTFVILSVICIIFIAAYSLVIDYKFPHDQMNFIFSLFFLVLTLNFLGRNIKNEEKAERARSVFTDIQIIILYCILSACYSIILIHSGVSVVKTAMIILSALMFYNFILIIFRKSVSLILFWINFYLFMGMLVFSVLPGLPLDLISRYNPFGGLIVYLLIS